jgi:hypothetical protein
MSLTARFAFAAAAVLAADARPPEGMMPIRKTKGGCRTQPRSRCS